MKLVIVRHGEPDYSIDSLTEKGWREAELLKKRMEKLDDPFFYCSPLGRAKDTAKPTLAALGKEAEIFDWLREFDGYVIDPATGKQRCSWDIKPALWADREVYYDRFTWTETEYMQSGNVSERYARVCAGIDALLKKHGYTHKENKNLYYTEHGNHDTVVLFCHFGVECVILSHLLGVSPVVLWHGFVALPTGVTTLTTEEREEGIASLRCSGFGDLSHLYAGDEPPSFAARFCETFYDEERHGV